MTGFWIAFILVLLASFSILGWIGTRIYQEAPPIPERVVTSGGDVLIDCVILKRGRTSGNRWAAWKSAPSGAMAATWRPIGLPTGCTGKRPSFLISGS
jgi:hypothetical protein